MKTAEKDPVVCSQRYRWAGWMVSSERGETILVEGVISVVFPAHGSGSGAVEAAAPPDVGAKTQKEEVFFSKAEIYCSNISFCFCFYSLLAVPSLRIAMGCLSVVLIHTHRVFVNYNNLRRNSEVLC